MKLLKEKVKVGEWRYTSRILNFNTRHRCVVSYLSRPLYSWRKRAWYPMNEMMGRTKSQSGCFRDKKKSNEPAKNQIMLPWLSNLQPST
jgi:hypothetical protein